MESACPICRSPQASSVDCGGGPKGTCPRCGQFKLEDFAAQESEKLTPPQIAKLSGWIRENPGTVVDSEKVWQVVSLRMPSVGEKAEKALILLARMYPKPGTVIDTLVWSTNVDELIGGSWCEDEEELAYVLKEYLGSEKDFLSIREDESFKITPKGWAFMDSLRHGDPISTIGFIAMWFDVAVDPVRTAIEAAIEKAGYKPLRIDRHQHNNRIDDEIVATIRRSKFVVADFTGQRGGVYFEAGFALGLGLPVIWLCRKDELPNVHFDNRQYNFILWQADKLEALTVALQNRIEATIGRGPLK